MNSLAPPLRAHGSRLELIATAMRTAHQGSAPLARAAMMARAAFGGIAEFRKWAASHCDVARLLGTRMGLSGPVQQSLRHLYERWDGNGMPGELRGTELEVLNTGPPYHTERTIDSGKFTRPPAGTSSRTLSVTSPPDVRNTAAMVRAILRDASAP